jgi:hypothetical protein
VYGPRKETASFGAQAARPMAPLEISLDFTRRVLQSTTARDSVSPEKRRPLMQTREVGEALVSLCRDGKNMDAIDTFYGEDIESIEPHGNEQMPREMHGIEAIRQKNAWFFENNDVHSASAEGPMVNGDKFPVIYDYELTPKQGPGAGARTRMREVAVYTVDDGEIIREEFFY